MAFRHLGPALVLAALSGCTPSSKDATPAEPRSLALVDSTSRIDALIREPMVVRHPSGALFTSGYWDSIPPLYRSDDDGRTWSRVDLGPRTAGATGNSDIDLAVGPDGGLYLITLEFDRAGYRGKSIQVATSRDVGKTWRWTRLSETTMDDRPWVEVAPDGTVHAIWNDGAGVSYAVSRDTGSTSTESDRISPSCGSSHLAIGPQGQVAVRYVPISASGNRFDPKSDGIAVSTDGGRSWRHHPPPNAEPWFPLIDSTVTPPRVGMPEQPRWVEPLAWDSTGALYAFWGADSAVSLARSVDQGATWTTWRLASGGAMTYFPYLVARGRGELAASWVSGKGASLRANVARIVVPDSGAPVMTAAEPFEFESFVLPGFGEPSQRDAAGEYLPVVFLPDGSIGIVTPIQNLPDRRMGFGWRRYRASP